MSMAATAIRLHQYGGPEVLRLDQVAVDPPKPGDVQIRQTAIGVNFIDIYQRTGLYALPSLPAILGSEAAGVVTALGDGVTNLSVGTRVAYGTIPGAYASVRNVPADRIVAVPDAISDAAAASMMLKGMTVRYLFLETFRVTPQTVILFHAAAGGVGLIACQWARAIGAKMIGTVGSAAKAEFARANGCAHVIDTSREDFVARVKELTQGRGVDVVYDSVGRDTYKGSLECLRAKGVFVSFGNSSGPVPSFDLALLKGSLFATRPSLFAYTANHDDLAANARDVFAMLETGAVMAVTNHTYRLSEAATAHHDLESRKTTGSLVLVP